MYFFFGSDFVVVFVANAQALKTEVSKEDAQKLEKTVSQVAASRSFAIKDRLKALSSGEAASSKEVAAAKVTRPQTQLLFFPFLSPTKIIEARTVYDAFRFSSARYWR